MKITKETLKQIIKEEVSSIMSEQPKSSVSTFAAEDAALRRELSDVVKKFDKELSSILARAKDKRKFNLLRDLMRKTIIGALIKLEIAPSESSVKAMFIDSEPASGPKAPLKLAGEPLSKQMTVTPITLKDLK